MSGQAGLAVAAGAGKALPWPSHSQPHVPCTEPEEGCRLSCFVL